MISIRVELPKNFKVPKLKQEVVDRALNAVMNYARAAIVKTAQERLSPSTAQTYIRGVMDGRSISLTQGSAVLTLVGKLPNMFEEGASSWDIKEAMLRKATKRTKKGEPYVDVPLDHGAPGTSGKPAMPVAVHTAMQASVAQAQASGSKNLLRGPSNMGAGSKNPNSGYTRKTSVYSGMVKTKGGDYKTIRRISGKSDPSSWIHPGFKALNLFPTIAKEIEKIGGKVVADYLKNL